MDERKRSTQAYFDQIGDRYGKLYQPADHPLQYPSGPVRMEKALRLLRRFKPAGRVLDCGCGTGHFIAELLAGGYEAHGIDISSQMIHEAQETIRQRGADSAAAARLRVGDVEKLAFPDAHFDAVSALGVLEYLHDDDKALAEIRRVLKPGGLAVIAFRNRLFNLFSLNAYTQREAAAGEVQRLIEEYQSELKAGFGDVNLGAWSAALAQQKPTSAPPPADRTPPIDKPIPIELRQHTPREAREVARRHGLECQAMLYFHFHPLPPAFEKADPAAFNRLGLSMESMDASPAGAIMASAFVCAFRLCS